MKIYWSLKAIPELASLSPQERNLIWKQAYSRTFRHWQTWLALLGGGLLAGIGSIVGSYPGAVLGGAIGGAIFGQVAIHQALPYIREMVATKQAQASD